jgi:transposase InsO family protein
VPHPNARLTPQGRKLLADRIRGGWTITTAADAAGISRQTGSKWWRRAQTGEFVDRSSAPHRPAVRHGPDIIAALCARRRELRVGPHVLAWEASLAPSTAYAILRRYDLGRLDRLESRPPVVRYERQRPGELVHLDTKQLGRIRPGGGLAAAHRTSGYDKGGRPGWNRVHLAIDDHSRLAYAEVLPDEKAVTAIGFLRRASAFYARYGIRIERLMTDNGPAYVSAIHALACRKLGIRHLRTRPYRPQTNGKAERFIRTLLAGWAYGAVYGSSEERARALDGWLWHYNHRRRHSALGRQPPVSRTNLLGSYT